jgi:hypothetical protein
MDSLTPKQAEALQARILPMFRYLSRCRQRVDKRGFDPRSEVYKAIDKAYCAVHGLRVTLHYESCKRGVGRPNEEKPGE